MRTGKSPAGTKPTRKGRPCARRGGRDACTFSATVSKLACASATARRGRGWSQGHCLFHRQRQRAPRRHSAAFTTIKRAAPRHGAGRALSWGARQRRGQQLTAGSAQRCAPKIDRKLERGLWTPAQGGRCWLRAGRETVGPPRKMALHVADRRRRGCRTGGLAGGRAASGQRRPARQRAARMMPSVSLRLARARCRPSRPAAGRRACGAEGAKDGGRVCLATRGWRLLWRNLRRGKLPC